MRDVGLKYIASGPGCSIKADAWNLLISRYRDYGDRLPGVILAVNDDLAPLLDVMAGWFVSTLKSAPDDFQQDVLRHIREAADRRPSL